MMNLNNPEGDVMSHPPPTNSSRKHKGVSKFAILVLGAFIIALILAWTTSSTHTVALPGRQPTPTPALVSEQADLLDPEAEGGTKEHEHLTNPDKGVGKSRVQIQADERSEETGVTITGSLAPNVGGAWQYAPELPEGFYPIHTIVMTRGVLLVAGSGNSEANHDAHMYLTYYCSPLVGDCQSIHTPDDLFCGDMLQLQDGSAIMAGGTTQWGTDGWKGAKWVYQFRETTMEWTRVANTKIGRWYPTTLLQTTGLVLIISGIDHNGKLAKKTETYDPESKKVGTTKGERKFPLYSRFWPTSVSGRYFFDGTGLGGVVGDVPPGYWYPKTNKFTPIKGLRARNQRSNGASCSIGDYASQNFLVMGGGTPAVNYVERITLKGTPVYKPASPLGAKKYYVSCVTLPNGWVFEVGGGSANKIANASLTASLYKSLTGARTPVNSLPTGEYFLYHNNLALLDDCRYVALYGSNPAGQARNTHVLFWTPPTQVNGCLGTPTLPATIKRYSKSVEADVPDGTAYLSVMVSGMVTHSKDNGGRMMKIPVKNGVADFSRIWLRYMPENHLKVRAVSTTGTWSDAVNITLT